MNTSSSSLKRDAAAAELDNAPSSPSKKARVDDADAAAAPAAPVPTPFSVPFQYLDDCDLERVWTLYVQERDDGVRADLLFEHASIPDETERRRVEDYVQKNAAISLYDISHNWDMVDDPTSTLGNVAGVWCMFPHNDAYDPARPHVKIERIVIVH